VVCQGIPQEVTQAKQLVGEAMLIDHMFFGPQDRIVVQQPVQHIQGFTHGAGNDLRMKHALLVGEMGVDRPGPVVIPEVARVERPKKGTGVEAEPLPIGRGEGPITPVVFWIC
jgi:hypothetical protein